MHRTFIAFEIKEEDRFKINQYLKLGQDVYKKGITWSKTENLHLTLQFIGDTKNEDLAKIDQFISDHLTLLKPMTLSNLKLEWFPNDNPRTLWLNYQNCDFATSQFHFGLKDFIKTLGYQIDHKKLLFHITLGRIKPWFDQEKIIWNQEMLSVLNSIKLEKIRFYKSTLTPNGPIYNIISEYNL